MAFFLFLWINVLFIKKEKIKKCGAVDYSSRHVLQSTVIFYKMREYTALSHIGF